MFAQAAVIKVDLVRMVQVTRIDETSIKKALSCLEMDNEIEQNLLCSTTTIEGLRKLLFENFPGSFSLRKKIFVKWLFLVKTTDQAKELYHRIPRGTYLEQRVFNRWCEIAEEEIENAQTFDTMMKLQGEIPFVDEIESRLIQKLASFFGK